MDGMTLYHKIKEIDSNVIICFTTADINYIQQLQKGIIDIEKIVLYKPVLLKDLKNKIDWLLSRQEVHGYGFLSILGCRKYSLFYLSYIGITIFFSIEFL